jgi:hypothetical protein
MHGAKRSSATRASPAWRAWHLERQITEDGRSHIRVSMGCWLSLQKPHCGQGKKLNWSSPGAALLSARMWPILRRDESDALADCESINADAGIGELDREGPVGDGAVCRIS